jgi:hypothetical protein
MWYSTLLPSARPQVQTAVPQKKKKRKNEISTKMSTTTVFLSTFLI